MFKISCVVECLWAFKILILKNLGKTMVSERTYVLG